MSENSIEQPEMISTEDISAIISKEDPPQAA